MSLSVPSLCRLQFGHPSFCSIEPTTPKYYDCNVINSHSNRRHASWPNTLCSGTFQFFLSTTMCTSMSAAMSAIMSSRCFARAQRRYHLPSDLQSTESVERRNGLTGIGARDTCVSKKWMMLNSFCI